MAKRPIYIPLKEGVPGVKIIEVEFPWFAGLATSQKQKSIRSLHKVAKQKDIFPILEVSSKSEDEIGVSLSAFNLMITTKKGIQYSVETAFQASKVFIQGGPFLDLLEKSSREAKQDSRLKTSGNLVKFKFYEKEFPLEPRTFFYDWLYLNALKQNPDLVKYALQFNGFTDIEFNPDKSINCQAYSLALYISLFKLNLLEDALSAPENLKAIAYQNKSSERTIQEELF